FSRVFFFFFNDTATTEIYTLSLHDALPIWWPTRIPRAHHCAAAHALLGPKRSEEHTSELQSLTNIVCRLLLEKRRHTRKTARQLRPACEDPRKSTRTRLW